MLALSLAAALAYESDTLTDRDQPLPDVTDALDQWVNDVIEEAIVDTNERTGCVEDPERTHLLLARAIHERTAPDQLVHDRGGLRAYGFDQLSAWIEQGGVPARRFDDRRDILGSLTVREAPLLVWAGVCATVRVNDQLVGTDKLDHFFEEGFAAWRRSRYGEDLEEAVAWATRTENGRYGLGTSEAFSFGDLRADADGMSFYDELLGPDGVAAVGPAGCLVPNRRFTWRDWVTWEYDEVLNPPVYTPSAQRGVTRHLETHRDAYCASYARWGSAEYEAHIAQVVQVTPWYAGPESPPRSDPYQLPALCRGDRASTDARSAQPPPARAPSRRERQREPRG